MDITINILPGPLPDICESAHERLAPPRRTHREDLQSLFQPKIIVIRPAGKASGNHEPLASSRQRATEKKVSFREAVSFTGRCFSSSQKRSPHPTPSHSQRITTEIPTSLKPASNPRKVETYAKKEKLMTFPSNSSMSSNIPDVSEKPMVRPSATAPTARCSAPSAARNPPMSAQADETVRIMDWAISLVKAAEERVRKEERAAHEKEAFELRLRKWEAEMKIRKMEENEEEERRNERAQPEDECTDPRMYWKGDHSDMSQCRLLMLNAQRQCRRGLSILLER